MPTPLDAAYLAVLGLASPWLGRRLVRSTHGRAEISQKLFGTVCLPQRCRPRVWFHGVSVGEIHLLRHVVRQFQARRPDCEAVVSASTETGLIEARRAFDTVIPWPFDFSWAVQRAIDRVRPNLIVLSESEVWPGFLLAAERFGAPVVVINGRMSPRSMRRWQLAGPLAPMLLNRIKSFAVQTHETANHLATLGLPVDRITVTGSVKFDGVATDRDNAQTQALAGLFGIDSNDTTWVCGSTQAPEEEGCIGIYQELKTRFPKLRLILVPRQKDRFDEVAEQLRRRCLPFIRRTALPCHVPQDAVILVDTIGELRAVWGLADVAFVGGSLDGHRGGQNMIEPAAYGSAVLFGPHVWNFQQVADQLLACGGAKLVSDFSRLSAEMEQMMNLSNRRMLGQNGRQFVASQAGATERTLALLDRFLPLLDARIAA